METSFENYAEFCAHMQQFFFSNQQSLIDCWEKWEKNQALFEYLIRDTQADTEARMNAYETLYYVLYLGDTQQFKNTRFNKLPPQFDKKMLAELMYNYFVTAKHFCRWGTPYISPPVICLGAVYSLGDNFIPFIYKQLDNSNLTPFPTPDWRFNGPEFNYRYADYAHSFLCMILRIEYPDASMCLSYEERLPEIIKMKSIVQAYCAEKGISLE